MKHLVRINGQITELDCDLDSGIRDKIGRHIYESDVVRNHVGIECRVHYRDGALFTDYRPLHLDDNGHFTAPDLTVVTVNEENVSMTKDKAISCLLSVERNLDEIADEVDPECRLKITRACSVIKSIVNWLKE